MRIDGSVTGMESERSYSAVNYSERNLRVSKVSGSGINGELGFGTKGGGSSFLDTLLGKYEDSAGKDHGQLGRAFSADDATGRNVPEKTRTRTRQLSAVYFKAGASGQEPLRADRSIRETAGGTDRPVSAGAWRIRLARCGYRPCPG